MLDIYALVSDLYNHECHGLYLCELSSYREKPVWVCKTKPIHCVCDKWFNIKCDLYFYSTKILYDRVRIMKRCVELGTPAFFVGDKIEKYDNPVCEFFEEDLELKVHGIDTRRKYWRSIYAFKNDELYQNSRLGQTV